MDSTTLEKYRNGDPQLFNEIMNEYQQPVYYYLIRMLRNEHDAEDITQETFVKAYTERKKFRGEASIKTWLFQIASNLAKNHLRWHSIRSFISLNSRYPSLTSPDESGNEQTQREQRLLKHLQHLSPRQRSVFILKYFNRLSHREIARIMDISEASSKTNFHYAVNALKDRIQEEEL